MKYYDDYYDTDRTHFKNRILQKRILMYAHLKNIDKIEN